jgi:hypothetical protein
VQISAADPVAPAWIGPAVGDRAGADRAADCFFAAAGFLCGCMRVDLGVEPGLGGTNEFLEQGHPCGGCLLGAVLPKGLRLAQRFTNELRKPERKALWEGRILKDG